jgi:parvulin-like peptidyl-prolyl isomerase
VKIPVAAAAVARTSALAALAIAVAAGASAGCKSDGSGAAATVPPPPPPLAAGVGSGAETSASVAPVTPERVATETTPPEKAAPASADAVVARVDNGVITMGQLAAPLVEGYGLNVLLNLVQLEMARQTAANAGVTVSEEDVAAERDLTLAQMVPDAAKEDYDQLLEQFLTQERISRPEFDLVLRTNAHLRKVARTKLKGEITDEQLHEAFGVLYGEKVQVRHIQASNLQEVQEARRRVEAGEPFEKVARELSRNERTKALGGELPAFSQATVGYPQAFKDAAFALKPGELSDAVQAEGAYHLLKLEQRIPPKAVKFEDVKEIIRTKLEDNAVQATMKALRQQLGRQALQEMKIENPVLREQFEAKRDQRQAEVKGRDEVRQQLAREREERERQRQQEQAQSATTDAASDATTQPAPAGDAGAVTPTAPAAPDSVPDAAQPPAPAVPGATEPANFPESARPANPTQSPDAPAASAPAPATAPATAK